MFYGLVGLLGFAGVVGQVDLGGMLKFCGLVGLLVFLDRNLVFDDPKECDYPKGIYDICTVITFSKAF